MNNLQESGLAEALNEAALIQKTPILGICLGMQLMASVSFENEDPKGCRGLNWFDAEVMKLEVGDTLRYKIPHTGWNSIHIEKSDGLLNGLSDYAEFYFVHSYHFKANDTQDILTKTVYESPFVSSICKENLYGVQFHPEKSHDHGLKLFKNFIKL
jgi:glutamine amidotransferase